MESRRMHAGLLPVQARPVPRQLFTARHQGNSAAGTGVVAAQNSCEGLEGLAQQMCYSVLYGI
jgi:hypothetical protein